MRKLLSLPSLLSSPAVPPPHRWYQGSGNAARHHGERSGFGGHDLALSTLCVQQAELTQQLPAAGTGREQGDPCRDRRALRPRGPWQRGSGSVEMPRQKHGRKGARNSPLTRSHGAELPLSRSQGRWGRASHPAGLGAQQPSASREHVPGSAAALRGPWQAAENKTAARTLWLLPRARLPATRMPERIERGRGSCEAGTAPEVPPQRLLCPGTSPASAKRR